MEDVSIKLAVNEIETLDWLVREGYGLNRAVVIKIALLNCCEKLETEKLLNEQRRRRQLIEGIGKKSVYE